MTPEGWVIDQQGDFITNSSAILMGLGREEAALLPLGGAGELLGGHKGYGLATMVEILSASLQSGSFLWALTGLDEKGNHKPFDLGHFFMAVDIEAYVPLDEFKRTTGEILRQLRSSRKMPGQPRIYTAGEKEYENEQRVQAQGVPVVPNLQRDIKIIQQELGLTGYDFPFKASPTKQRTLLSLASAVVILIRLTSVRIRRMDGMICSADPNWVIIW